MKNLWLSGGGEDEDFIHGMQRYVPASLLQPLGGGLHMFAQRIGQYELRLGLLYLCNAMKQGMNLRFFVEEVAADYAIKGLVDLRIAPVESLTMDMPHAILYGVRFAVGYAGRVKIGGCDGCCPQFCRDNGGESEPAAKLYDAALLYAVGVLCKVFC